MVYLTEETLRPFLVENEHALVVYSHWCMRSKKEMVKFQHLAKHMKELDPPVPFAKIDVGVYDGIAK
jgi:hypothetical protein